MFSSGDGGVGDGDPGLCLLVLCVVHYLYFPRSCYPDLHHQRWYKYYQVYSGIPCFMSLVCLFGKSIASTDLLSVTAVGGTVNIPETGRSKSSQSYCH